MNADPKLVNLRYDRDDVFTAPGSYFHFTEPFRLIFPGLAALHCAYDLKQPVTISDCLLTVGLQMTRERRPLWKTDPRNAIHSYPHLLEKVCFMDQIGITTRSVFASEREVVTQIEIHNGEAREIRFLPRLMGGWFQTGRAAFAANRLTLQHLVPDQQTWRTVAIVPSFRVRAAKVARPTVNVHCEWPQLEGTRFGPANMYELYGEEVRLAAGRTHRCTVLLWLEIGRVKPPRGLRAGGFEAARRRAGRAAAAHVGKAALTSANSALADRYAYAKYVLRSNLIASREGIHGPVSLANKKLCGLWFWDTCFHAMGWATLDRRIAENHLRALLRGQLRNGLVPQVISNRRTIAGQPQPPVLLMLAFEVYRFHRNESFMREVLPAVERLHAWWDRERFDPRWGLYFFKNAFDSGWDNSARYDEGRGWIAPDLNAMMYRNLEVEEFFHRRWGDQAKAAACAERRVRLGQAMQARLWNDAQGFFCDGDARTAGRLFAVKTPAGFLPLVVQDLPAARKRAVLRHLLNPAEFWLPHPVPTLSADDPRFVPWEYSYPRGTTWMSYGNWLTYFALRRGGLDAAAHALALRTLRTIAGADRHSIYEHYNPLTGQPHGYAMFGWTSAVTIDLVRREYGVDFTDDGDWIFTAPDVPEPYRLDLAVRGRRVVCDGDGRRTRVTVAGRRVATLARGTRCVMNADFETLTTMSLRNPRGR